MRIIYFFKASLITFLIGLFVCLEGILFKIRLWPYANEMLTISVYIFGAAIALAIIKIALIKNPDGN